MTWWCRVAALFFLVGFVLLPLRAVAATVPRLIAYDAAVPSTATTVPRADAPVRSEAEPPSISAYEAARCGYDDRPNLRLAARVGVVRAYDGGLNLDERSELAEGVIYDARTATTAAEGAQTLSASAIRFSQSSVNGVGEIAESMAANGWKGAPIDVVQMGDGLVTVDNTRLLAAHMTDTPVQALVHGAGEALPESMAGRFGNATTWGEAVTNRIAGQNAAYQSLFPNGSWAVGVGTP